MMRENLLLRRGAAGLWLMALAGCASQPLNVAPLPPAQYRVLGPATGKACGTLGILGTAINFIPMQLNTRVERAYQQALQSVPGATGLVDVQIQDDWFWWLLASTRCTTVSGNAIKEGRT